MRRLGIPAVAIVICISLFCDRWREHRDAPLRHAIATIQIPDPQSEISCGVLARQQPMVLLVSQRGLAAAASAWAHALQRLTPLS
jgi:hypothetical protein